MKSIVRNRVARGSRIERAGRLQGALAWAVALIVSFPFLYLVVTGFKTEADAPMMPPAFIPVGSGTDMAWGFSPTLENYETVLTGGFWPFVTNSAIAVVVSTVLALALAIPAAYALALPETTGKKDVLFFFISTKFLPAVGTIIPVFMIARRLNLLDSIVGLVVMYTAMNLPIAVWMLRAFFHDVPDAIYEAARVDGASRFQQLVLIGLPLVRSGIVATAFLIVVFSWNEFFVALILTTTDAATVPMYMVSFMSAQGLWYAKMAAAGTLAAMPIVMLGWMSQRQLVRGLSMGAVK